MTKVLGVIPARYGSERFPGKVLADLNGKPMVQWVYESAIKCSSLDHVVIATDHETVLDVAKRFGADCLMTSVNHKTGTDRLVETALKFPDYDLIVNIQGDEPGIEPDLIDGVVTLLRDRPEWDVTTAARPFGTGEDATVPDRVKVVFTRSRRALYFSRSLIPYPRKPSGWTPHLHLGIYAYRREFLFRFHELPSSLLEESESLEQLRVIENDCSIGVHVVSTSLPGVDTPEDLQFIRSLLK